MPLVRMQTNVGCEKDKKERIARGLSAICSECTGKPESYVAALVEDDSVISFAGKLAGSAFVEVRGIGGLNKTVNRKLSAAICGYLEKELGIDGSQIYINFFDIPAENWGWKGTTFG